MKKRFRHLVMFPPTLIYFSLQRKKKREMYLLFKQLAEKKWYKWQWRILDDVMRVYPQISNDPDNRKIPGQER